MTEPEQLRHAVQEAITESSFCTLATSSAENRPHVVGVLYVAVDGILYVSTTRQSTKARNIAQNRRVAVCIPVAQHPGLPPLCVQFQGTAEICSVQDPRLAALMQAGRLDAIVGHGALAEPGICFLRITPGRRVAAYGIGVPLDELMRDPIHASRSVVLA